MADHEPPEGWDAPLVRQPDGIIVHGSFYSWGDLGAVPVAKFRRVSAERDDLTAKAKKAKREAAEAERQAKRDARPEPCPLKGARWMITTPAGWTWHEWSDDIGWYVDTGIRPVPDRPLAQQRPEGR